MKKFLVAISAMALSFGAFAQKGVSEVGINVDVAPTFSSDPTSVNVGVGAKYRYGISNHFRLEGGFNYYFKSSADYTMWDFSVNAQYLISLNEKWTFYPIAGLGLIHTAKSDDTNLSDKAQDAANNGGYNGDAEDFLGISKNAIVLNLGLGIEYTITEKWSAGLEIKYPVKVDINPIPISISIAYKF